MKTSKKNLLLSIMLVIIIALTVSNVWTYTNLQNSNTNTSQVIQPNQSTIELQSTQTPSPFPNTTSVQSVWQLPLPPDNSQPGHFNGPIDIAVDMGGNVYVADSGNSRIQIFNSNGKFITQWLSFYDLRAIAIANNNLFTLQDNVIKKFTLNGTLLTSWTAPSPIDLAVDSNGTVYVLDSADYCVQKYTDNGTFIKHFGSHGEGSGKFVDSPYGIAVDGSGNVYVSAIISSESSGPFGKVPDGGVVKFTSNGDYLTQLGVMNLYYPKQVSVDPKGYVYVVDTGSGFVDGTVVFAPNGDWLGSQLEPASLAFDINGYIYLADPARNTISKLSPIQ